MDRGISIKKIFSFMKGKNKMKKLLVLIALILCVSMLFVACNKNDAVEDDQAPVDNVEANIAMLVKALNKCETADGLLDTTTKTVDYEALIAELKKVSAQGSANISAVVDGEDEGTLDFEFAIKDNVLNANAEVDDEKVGIYASISDAYKLSFAAWEDEDDIEAGAFDIKSIMEEVMEMAEESMGDEMPIDLSEIKMPVFTADSIKYEDGKYILDKNFLYEAIVATADSAIDAAMDEGILPEDFEEEYDDIKEIAKDVVEVVDVKIYFLIKCEVIEGIGVNLNLDLDKIAKACGETNESGCEYVKASVELSAKGETLNVEYKEDGNVNKIDVKIDWIYDGDAICGFDAKYDLDMTTGYESSHGDESSSSKSESTTVMKQTITAKLDLSAFEKADSTVFELDVKVSEDCTFDHEYTSGNSEFIKTSRHDINETTLTASVKTTEANKANIVINGLNKYDETYNGENDKGESEIEITGTISFTTKDVTVPAPSKDVQDAIDDAEIIDSMDDMGAQEAPAPDYGYDDEYYGDDYYNEEYYN